MTKGILVVKSISLLKTFRNETSLVSANGPVSLPLDFKHPFSINDVDP
jgi:hypothetical protein